MSGDVSVSVQGQGSIGAASGMRPGGRGGRIMPPFTSETSRAAQARKLVVLERKREELRRAALDAGNIAAAQVADLPSPDRAGLLRAIFANHYLHAYDAGAHGSQASLRLVLQHAYPEPKQQGPAPEQVAAAAAGTAMGVELARRLLEMLRREDGGQER